MWALWCDYFGAWKILLAGLFGWSGLSGCSGWFGFLGWSCYDFIVDLHWFRYMLRMGGPEMEDTQRGPSKLKMWYHCVQENYPPRKVAKFLRKKKSTVMSKKHAKLGRQMRKPDILWMAQWKSETPTNMGNPERCLWIWESRINGFSTVVL